MKNLKKILFTFFITLNIFFSAPPSQAFQCKDVYHKSFDKQKLIRVLEEFSQRFDENKKCNPMGCVTNVADILKILDQQYGLEYLENIHDLQVIVFANRNPRRNIFVNADYVREDIKDRFRERGSSAFSHHAAIIINKHVIDFSYKDGLQITPLHEYLFNMFGKLDKNSNQPTFHEDFMVFFFNPVYDTIDIMFGPQSGPGFWIAFMEYRSDYNHELRKPSIFNGRNSVKTLYFRHRPQ